MNKTVLHIITLVVIFILACSSSFSQEIDRIDVIEEKLTLLAKDVKGLNQELEISISGASIQEFIRALAFNNDLNISIDPSLNYKISNNFSQESPINIILYLCKQYSLGIETTGSIIHLKPFVDDSKKAIKRGTIEFNSYNKLVNLDLKNDSLIHVVKELVNTSDQNIIITPGLEGRKVSLFVKGMTLENALEKLTFANGLVLNKTDDDVFVITTPAQPGRNENATNTGGYRPVTKRSNLNLQTNVDSLGNQLISLGAYDIPLKDIVEGISDELGINYFFYSNIEGRVSLNVQEVSFEKLLNLLFNNTNYTFRFEGGIYLFGERSLEQIRGVVVHQLKYRSVEFLDPAIPGQYRADLEIKTFDELNSLVLSGAVPRIKELQYFLEEIDRVVPMIHIEVIIVDVKKDRRVASGISAGISEEPVTSSGTVLPGLDLVLGSGSLNRLLDQLPGNFFNLGRVTPNFYVGLQAMEENNDINIESTPHLATLNSHEASVTIGEKLFYEQQESRFVGTENPQTVVTQQFIETSADLSIIIKPYVSGDEEITLDISVDAETFILNPNSTAPPGIASRSFKSLVRMKDQEMIVLGGLSQKESSQGGSGLPLLSRIPFFKWFFGKRSKMKNDSRLVVFIKPTVIY